MPKATYKIQQSFVKKTFTWLTDRSKTLFSRDNPGYWTKPGDKTQADFLGKLAEKSSQREDWYAVTPYISEFSCAVSNAGFFYVAHKHQCPEVALAGLASLVSHSAPKQWLLTLDRLGIALVGIKVLREYKTIQKHPKLLWLLPALAGINFADAYLARVHGKTWPHVAWHLSAAWIIDIFFSHSKK